MGANRSNLHLGVAGGKIGFRRRPAERDSSVHGPMRLFCTPPRVISRAPAVGWDMESSMRADVETAAADIEQSIELLRRRL